MPAPIAKGSRPSPSSGENRRGPNVAKPLGTGLIIAASVLVAAGIAFYENPHIRQWVNNSRRKIAIALHHIGDEIQPPSEEERRAREEEQRRRRRQETARRNRDDLVRQAREEGIAVDLDELRRIGCEPDPEEPPPKRRHTGSSFDDLVNSDGTLRESGSVSMATATNAQSAGQALRRRGAGSQGLEQGATLANPFTDEAHLLHDNHPMEESYRSLPSTSQERESRASTSTLQDDHPGRPSAPIEEEDDPDLKAAIAASLADMEEWKRQQAAELELETSLAALPPGREPITTSHLIDVSVPEPILAAPSQWDIEASTTVSNSLYDVPSPPPPATIDTIVVRPGRPIPITDADDDFDATTPGVMTPRTEDAISVISGHDIEFPSPPTAPQSLAQSFASLEEMQQEQRDIDARSEAFSEAFTDAALSVTSGMRTPADWTDVGSDEGSDDGRGVR